MAIAAEITAGRMITHLRRRMSSSNVSTEYCLLGIKRCLHLCKKGGPEVQTDCHRLPRQITDGADGDYRGRRVVMHEGILHVCVNVARQAEAQSRCRDGRSKTRSGPVNAVGTLSAAAAQVPLQPVAEATAHRGLRCVG